MLEVKSLDIEKNKWKLLLERHNAISGNGGNKLRTYRKLKHSIVQKTILCVICHFDIDQLLQILGVVMRHLSAFTNFRCCNAPLRIETCRYENIDVSNRNCLNCPDYVEDEKHVLFDCPLYCDIRNNLVSALENMFANNDKMSDDDQLVRMFSDENLVYLSAKACHHILVERKRKLYCRV